MFGEHCNEVKVARWTDLTAGNTLTDIKIQHRAVMVASLPVERYTGLEQHLNITSIVGFSLEEDQRVSTLSVTGLDLTVIALYMLALLAIGLLSERIAIRTLDNYLLANRQLSYLLYVPVTVATPG